MPILGNRWPDFAPTTKWEADPWTSVSVDEIRQAFAELVDANQSSPSNEIAEQIDDANAALVEAGNGQPVEMAVDPSDSRIYFATGPRFVPKGELSFNLAAVIEKSSYILQGPGLDYDLTDDELVAAIRRALIDVNLLRETPQGDRYESFSDEHQFHNVIVKALEDWERSLGHRSASNEEKLEIGSGLIPEQSVVLEEQIRAIRADVEDDFKLEDLMSNLTPASGKEFVRQIRNHGKSYPEPMESFLQRLDALGSRY